MKKLSIALFILLLTTPTWASAHTSIETSTPEQGEVVRENLKEITLTYEGEIGTISTMEMVIGEKEVPFEHIVVKNNQMTGVLKEELANGTYEVIWKAIGKDGHPIDGELSFTVDKEIVAKPVVAEKKEKVSEEKTTGDISGAKKTLVALLGAFSIGIITFGLLRKKN